MNLRASLASALLIVVAVFSAGLAGASSSLASGGYSCTVSGTIVNEFGGTTPSGCVLQLQSNGDSGFSAGNLSTHVGTRLCRYVLNTSSSSNTIGDRGIGSLTLVFDLEPGQPSNCPGLLAHLDIVVFDDGKSMNLVNTDDGNVYTGTCWSQ
jgi:hypothetical protein